MPAPIAHIPTTAGGGPMSYAIFQLARAHRGCAAAMLREVDLHPGQELLLMHLFDRDGQTQAELVESVGLDHSTVSKSLLHHRRGHQQPHSLGVPSTGGAVGAICTEGARRSSRPSQE